MNSIDRSEFLDEAVRLLERRQASPERPYWRGHEEDQGDSYCFTCINLLKPWQGEYGEDYDGGFCCEEDGSVHCVDCGKLLQYTLTTYGVGYELESFSQGRFDWNNSDECYELAEIANSIYKNDEQYETLFQILVNGLNFPEELKTVLPQISRSLQCKQRQ